MTVIRPNSVSGITSITAQANEINFFRSNGTLAGLQLNGVNFNTTTGVSTFNNLNVGGVLTYQDVTNVDSVGIITARSDVSIADKIIHTGDTNTAIRFPSADTITAETAGTERLRITSTGEVKIMNTSGTVGLYFQSSSGAVSNFRAIGTNNQSLGYFFGNTERVRFSSDGNLEIRTTTQNAFVGLVTTSNAINLTFGGTGGSSPRMYFYGTDNGQSSAGDIFTGAGTGGILHYRSGGLIKFEVNSDNSTAEALRINSNGYLGINDTDSTVGLSINKFGTQPVENGNTYPYPAGQWSTVWNTTTGNNTDYWCGFVGGYNVSSATVNISLAPNTYNLNNQQGIYIAGEATSITTADFTLGKIIGGSQTGASNSAGNQRATKSEMLRIDSSGNILLSKGTQNTLMSYTSDGSDNQSIFVGGGGGPSDTRGAYIWAKGNEYTTTGGFLQLNAGNVGTAPITFSTGGNEKARITSAGQLAIRNTGTTSTSVNLLVYGDSDNSDIATFSGGDFNRGLKISTTANGGQNDQNVVYNAQGDNGQHIFATGGNYVGRFEHDQSGFISENTASGDGDTEVGVALQNDYSSWGVIYKNDWIGNGSGWGTFWAGNGGARYRRVSSDNNPNEHVMVGSGNKRFTFDLDGGGNAYFDGSLSQNAYDYAEYFEWEDGNPSNEDRRGYSVFVNSNGKIEKATDSTNTAEIIGVISGTAAVVGDAAIYDWQGKWKVDEWGTVVTEVVKQVSWKDDEGKKHSYDLDKVPSGITIPSHASYRQHKRRILNTDYDDSKEYVPRDMRQEWDTVGLLGKVRVRDDSPKNPNWKFIKIVDGKKLWLIR